MKLIGRALCALLCGIVIHTAPALAASVPEPDSGDVAEFFGTQMPRQGDERRLAQIGCQYGWYAISRNMMDSAESAFDKAIQFDAGCGCGYLGMARVKKLQHADAESEKFYKEAIERDPSLESAANKAKISESTAGMAQAGHKNAMMATEDGWKKFKAKDYEGALKYFDYAQYQDATYAPGYFGMAYVYSVQGKLDQAVKFYRDTIKRDASYPPAYANLGYALLLQGKTDEAQKQLDQALKRDPKQGDAVMNFAYYFADKDKWDTAKRYFDDAVKRGARLNPAATAGFKKHGLAMPGR